MTCPHCHQPTCATTAALHDGQVVCTWSEDWRHECEAMHVLRMPTLQDRQHYLFGKFERVNERGQWINKCTRKGIQQSRGAEALERLKKTMTHLWQNNNKAQAK